MAYYDNPNKAFRLDFYTLAVGILVLFHLVANGIWIYLNKVPPAHDAGLHTVLSMRFFDYIKGFPGNFSIVEFLTISKYYPPLSHIVGTLFVWFGNYNYQFVQLTGSVFLSLSLIMMYIYTVKLTKNKAMALLSTVLFSFFYLEFRESRSHMTDIPLTFFIIGGLYFFEQSDNLRSRIFSIFFFVFFSLAFLTKWTSLIFFLFPVFRVGIKLLKKDGIAKRDIVKNIFLGLIITLVFCLPWYYVNLKTIVQIAQVTSTPELDDPSIVFSWDTIFFYLRQIIIFQISFIGFLFFLFSVIRLNIVRKYTNTLKILIIQIVIGYIFFTFFIGNKNVRFLFPMMPFIAIVIAMGLVDIRNRIGKSLLIGMILTYYVFSYFVVSFGIPLYPKYKHAINFPLVGWVDVYYLSDKPVSAMYKKENWENDRIASLILEHSKGLKHFIYFINIEKPYLNASTIHLSIYSLSKGFPKNIQEVDTNFPMILNGSAEFVNQADLEQWVNGIDFVTIPLRDIGPQEAMRDYNVRRQIQQYFLKTTPYGFTKVSTIDLPDGNEVFLYKKQASF